MVRKDHEAVKEEVNSKCQMHLEKTRRTKQIKEKTAQQSYLVELTWEYEASLKPIIHMSSELVGN